MSKKWIACAVWVFFAFSLNAVFAEMQYPQELQKEIALYPKAQIIQTMNLSGAVMVMMEVGDEPASVLDYYKKELATNGWTIAGEIKQEGTTILMGEKGSNHMIVNIGSDRSGKSMVTLSIAPKQ